MRSKKVECGHPQEVHLGLRILSFNAFKNGAQGGEGWGAVCLTCGPMVSPPTVSPPDLLRDKLDTMNSLTLLFSKVVVTLMQWGHITQDRSPCPRVGLVVG